MSDNLGMPIVCAAGIIGFAIYLSATPPTIVNTTTPATKTTDRLPASPDACATAGFKRGDIVRHRGMMPPEQWYVVTRLYQKHLAPDCTIRIRNPNTFTSHDTYPDLIELVN